MQLQALRPHLAHRCHAAAAAYGGPARLAAWLSTPDVVQPARLAPLFDRRLAEHVHRAALRTLVASYERICAEVRKPANKYEAANTILGAQRPFGSLQALRQILGIEEEEAGT